MNVRARLTTLVTRAIGMVAVVAYVQTPAPPAQSEWTYPAAASGYTGTATGLATDPSGAIITIARGDLVPGAPAPAATAFSSVSARLPAETLRGRRLTLRAELQTRGAGGASLWMRVDRGPGDMLMLDNGGDRAVRGDAEAAPFTVTLPVPSSATSVMFGVILQGGGSVTARSVRLEIGPALSPTAPNDPRDVYPAIRFLLAALKDRHSFLMPPSANTAFQTGGAENPPVEIRALPDRIGYISVPAYGGGDRAAMQAYTRRFHDELGKVQSAAGCGWIVDLRPNTGGNMWPMLAGLKPFLANEPLGTFVSREGAGPPWRAGQAVDVEPPMSLRHLEGAWVAVLTGPRTASSGEAVTISFKGRQKTRSFGQPTAGLSTANQAFQLPDGAAILLTTAIEADRTGKQYGEKVDPDEIVPAPAPGATEPDAAIAAATGWLRASCQKTST